MKKIKYLISFLLITAFIIGCTEDDDNTRFVDDIAAPTNVSASVSVTQDNTYLVTITPLGEGMVNFELDFGDNSEGSGVIQPGDNVDHVYEEGTYTLEITANGLNGLKTVVNQQLIVSFQAPQNLVVSIENDLAVSKQVNVTATADFALSYDVSFGDANNTVLSANIDEGISFIYEDA